MELNRGKEGIVNMEDAKLNQLIDGRVGILLFYRLCVFGSYTVDTQFNQLSWRN